jgi:hypothetical protein
MEKDGKNERRKEIRIKKNICSNVQLPRTL